MPEEIYLVVRWAVVPAHAEEEPPREVRNGCLWLAENALPLSSLTDSRVVLDVQYRLSFKLARSPAAAET
ncbi:hypothetical protein ACGFYZ_03855 [Streptomyces sp. NPDC048330]|uniref:hypothetical protein n=1 Tax=Streptomyces sp. NPDC048330 TaxID=3365533 RepID=UPI00371A2956